MENESGVSDESAIYSGTFLGLQDSIQQNMTDRLNRQAAMYAADMAGKQRIIDNYEAGMVLLGSEVKSLREKKLNLKDQSKQSLTVCCKYFHQKS